MREFNELNAIQEMNFKWLLNNGWTIPGNLAYRHILFEFNQTGTLTTERIEQIIMQHEALDQTEKIKSEFISLLELKKVLFDDFRNNAQNLN